MLLFLINHSI